MKWNRVEQCVFWGLQEVPLDIDELVKDFIALMQKHGIAKMKGGVFFLGEDGKILIKDASFEGRGGKEWLGVSLKEEKLNAAKEAE